MKTKVGDYNPHLGSGCIAKSHRKLKKKKKEMPMLHSRPNKSESIIEEKVWINLNKSFLFTENFLLKSDLNEIHFVGRDSISEKLWEDQYYL